MPTKMKRGGSSHHIPVMSQGGGIMTVNWKHNRPQLGLTPPSKTFIHQTRFTTGFSIKYNSVMLILWLGKTNKSRRSVHGYTARTGCLAKTVHRIVLTIYSPPPTFSPGWYDRSFINTEQMQYVLQNSVLLMHRSVIVQWFSPHHHLQQSHLFNIPWIKVSWLFF
jgi:hypothetical protein